MSKGDNTIVAILDDGFDYNHINLEANILRDSQDNIIGANFTDDGNQTPMYSLQKDSHGTNMAGLIASPINSEGMVGAAPNAKIMPLKIAYDHDWYSGWVTDDIWKINAFDFARNNGADVINCNWNQFEYYEFQNGQPVMKLAMIDAYELGRDEKGIPILFSVGNNQTNFLAEEYFTFGVGATNPNDERYSWSAISGYLDFVAPSGSDSQSIVNPTTHIEPEVYRMYSDGTSSSTATASGVIATVLSLNPQIEIEDLRTLLQNTADKVSGMGGQSFTNEYGHGRLNAYSAVKHALPMQFENHAFTSSQTLTEKAHIFGNATLSSGITLTIAADNVAVIDGTLSGVGATNAHLVVEGKLIIDSGANLDGIRLTVEDGGELLSRPGVTMDMNNSTITVRGDADFTGDFTMLRGSLQKTPRNSANSAVIITKPQFAA